MRRLCHQISAFALVAGLLAVPAGASAAGWLPTQSVPAVSDAIVFNAQGDALAVGRSVQGALQATTRPFGGSWAAETTLPSTDGTSPSAPKLTIDAQGNAVAAWGASSETEEGRPVYVANRPAGGAWTAPVRLSTGYGRSTDYALATDRQGTTTVVWTEFDGTAFVLRGVSLPTSGPWTAAASAAVDLTTSADGDVLLPHVAAGSNGGATVVWIETDHGQPNAVDLVGTVRSRSRSQTGGGWGAAHDVSGTGIVENPQVVVDSDGDSVVLWSQEDDGRKIRRVVRSASGSWGPETQLGSGHESHVVAGPDGKLTAVWVRRDDDESTVHASTSSDGTTWDAPVALATSARPLVAPRVAAGPDGDVTAIWNRLSEGTTTVQVARLTVGRSWSREADLSLGEVWFHASAIDPMGHLTVAWFGPTALPSASSIFDPVAPELRNIAVPTAGVAGQPVHASVDPFDISAVTVNWDFGDGGSASGAAAIHVFTTPGERTVTVTGVDAAGNETAATRTITITAAPGTDSDPDPKTDPNLNPNPKTDPKGDATPKTDPIRIPRTPPGLDAAPLLAPALSGLQQSASRWTTRKVRGSRTAVGTAFRFRLNRAAQVRLSFEQVEAGRKAGKTCAKPTKKNRGGSACKRVSQRGAIVVAGKAGSNSVTFRGKVGGRTLKPGSYRVTVSAIAGGATSKTATRTFTIVDSSRSASPSSR